MALMHAIDEQLFRIGTARIGRQALAVNRPLLCLPADEPHAALLDKAGQYLRAREDRPRLTNERIAILWRHSLQPIHAGLDEKGRAGRILVNHALDVLAGDDAY